MKRKILWILVALGSLCSPARPQGRSTSAAPANMSTGPGRAPGHGRAPQAGVGLGHPSDTKTASVLYFSGRPDYAQAFGLTFSGEVLEWPNRAAC